MPNRRPNILTYPFDGLVESLYTPVEIFTAPYDKKRSFAGTALWDTGAEISAIAPNVAQRLKLKAHDKMLVKGFGGEEYADVVLVSLMFPNQKSLERIKAIVSDAVDATGVIIGMDIISQMDFAISNGGGKTLFSFASPPFEDKFDFDVWKKTLEGKGA